MRLTGKIATVIVAGLAVIAMTSMASAKDKKVDGRTLFREHCKVCHGPDSPNGEYTPMTLIQDQWEDFFDNNYVNTHKDVVDAKHGNKKVTDVITPEMLKKIKKFAIDHAADSEHPMTCG